MDLASSRVDLSIPSSRGTYPVWIGDGILSESWNFLGPILGQRPVAVVTQRRLLRLFQKPLTESWPRGQKAPLWIEIPQGEKAKSLAQIQRAASKLARASFPRDGVLVALGGGVVGDYAGCLASLYMRGVDWIQVPTTLLAQVDSSVGGKVAVNLPQGKNLLGAFYPPNAVLMDPATLRSLPAREIRAGATEILKMGLIQSPELFERCQREFPRPVSWIPFQAEAVRLKAEVVAEDETEKGRRMVLNLGHTYGHALEALGGYRQLIHGEAVALGLEFAFRLAAKRERISLDVRDRVLQVLKQGELLPELPDFAPEKIYRRMLGDKKATSKGLRFILPTGIGDVEVISDLSQGEVFQIHQEMRSARKA